MKKFLLCVGTSLIVASPIALAMSCGKSNSFNKKLSEPSKGIHNLEKTLNLNDSNEFSIGINLKNQTDSCFAPIKDIQKNYYDNITKYQQEHKMAFGSAAGEMVAFYKQSLVNFIYKIGEVHLVTKIKYKNSISVAYDDVIDFTKKFPVSIIESSSSLDFEKIKIDFKLLLNSLFIPTEAEVKEIYNNSNYNEWYMDTEAKKGVRLDIAGASNPLVEFFDHRLGMNSLYTVSITPHSNSSAFYEAFRKDLQEQLISGETDKISWSNIKVNQ